MHPFVDYLVPLFVTIDPLGALPVFVAVTAGMPAARRRRATFEAVSAALVITLAFMFAGNATFRYLGITAADFRIAGGLLLLVLAVLDLLTPGKPAVDEHASVGIFPLALPLIAGPATLTTVLVLADRGPHGYAMTALSLSANLGLLLAVLLAAGTVTRVVGVNALRAFSKLVMILLAAIAVNLIRTGVAMAWAAGGK